MRRTLAAAVLSAAVVTLPTSGPHGGLWAFLSALFGGPAAPSAAAWPAKEGCGMDPNGLCKGAAPSRTEEGCGADPNGHCPATAPRTGAGCGADPSGLCLPGS
jgi:hypothetical protein